VCGLESATAKYACIWCKCPKDKRYDMSLQWSIYDPEQGARSIEEIKEKTKLPKKANYISTVVEILYFPLSPSVV